LRTAICPRAAGTYQVILYVDHRLPGGPERVCIEEGCGEGQARNLALNLLLGTYLDEVHPLSDPSARESRARQVWCELTPVRRVGNRWEPDPAADDHVDVASLDGDGRVIFDPAASAILAPRARLVSRSGMPDRLRS
jgi:hypothetical protein